MNFLPYERVTLRTGDSPETARARLEAMIAQGWFFWTRPPQPFRGTLDGYEFKIVRQLGFLVRNSFQPVIVGELVPGLEGTEIRLRLRLHAFVAGSMGLGFGMMFFLLVVTLARAIRRGLDVSEPILGGLMMGAFGYALVSLSFWPEVKRAKELLRAGLECGEVGGPNRLVRAE